MEWGVLTHDYTIRASLCEIGARSQPCPLGVLIVHINQHLRMGSD